MLFERDVDFVVVARSCICDLDGVVFNGVKRLAIFETGFCGLADESIVASGFSELVDERSGEFSTGVSHSILDELVDLVGEDFDDPVGDEVGGGSTFLREGDNFFSRDSDLDGLVDAVSRIESSVSGFLLGEAGKEVTLAMLVATSGFDDSTTLNSCDSVFLRDLPLIPSKALGAIVVGDFCRTDFVLWGGGDTSARRLFFQPNLIGLYDSFFVKSDFEFTRASCSFLDVVFFLIVVGCLVWLRFGLTSDDNFLTGCLEFGGDLDFDRILDGLFFS